MNVLVIAEDFRNDQFILKPLVRAMLAEAGKPRVRVFMCHKPLFMGIAEAMSWANIEKVLNDWGNWIDLFILCVDRDGNANRRKALDALEKKARSWLGERRHTGSFSENAWQEVEVWILAGHDLPKEWVWQDIRNEPHSKEAYFEPFAALRGVVGTAGDGRKILGEEAAKRYNRIRKRCRDDVAVLERRISQWLDRREV